MQCVSVGSATKPSLHAQSLVAVQVEFAVHVQVPVQPSEPQLVPSQRGTQVDTQRPAALQLCVPGQRGPHECPQASVPQTRPSPAHVSGQSGKHEFPVQC